jgi:general secretion pathway protein G
MLRMRRTGGFSLPEVLVALALIAILTAVLMPGLTSQVRKSDATRIEGDLTALQAAIQAFVADVHRFPATTTQLTTPLVNGATDLDVATIPNSLVARWKGPYLTKSLIGNTAVGAISNTFTRVTDSGTGVDYIVVTVTNTTNTEFAEIEDMLDAGTASSTSSTAGSVRFSGTTLTFFALPIR